MFTKDRQFRTRLLQVADAALLAFALVLAYSVRVAFPWWELPELESLDKYLWLLPLVALLGPAMLASQSLYETPRAWSHAHAVLRILRACTFLVLGLILLLFLARVQIARSVVILTGFFGGVLVYARHEVALWLQRTRSFPERRRTLWIGQPGELVRLRARLSSMEREILESVADFDPDSSNATTLVANLHQHSVNLVVVSLPGIDATRLDPLLSACEREGIEVLLRPGFLSVSPFRMAAEVFAGEAAFYLRAQSADPAQLFLKQCLDYALAAVLLVLLSPLFLFCALAIRLSSPGPVLFRQTRAGLNGMPFGMLKFRSMQADAERRQAELESRNEMKGPVFKVSNDPRITPVGRFMRRHSLDELPQLWNVLRGEMSLVGPRPLPISEVGRFLDDAHRRRLSVKPGLTCLWQISGRNDIADFEEWVRLDLAYIDQWSLWLDLRILLATIPVTLLGRGGR